MASSARRIRPPSMGNAGIMLKTPMIMLAKNRYRPRSPIDEGMDTLAHSPGKLRTHHNAPAITKLTAGPATVINSSSTGLRGMASNSAIPPRGVSRIRRTRTPNCLAVNECPSSWRTTHVKTARKIVGLQQSAEIRYSLSRVLSSRGYVVSEASSGEQGVALVKNGPPADLIFLDIRMTGMSGLEALQHIRSANPKQLVILMTAFGTAQTAIEAMKFGALDYVMKPFDPQRVLSLAENALKTHADLRAVGEYKPTINTEDYKEGIVGSSPVMQEGFKVIGQVTASDVTVMITGESGTGKELVARSIWKHSHRAGKPFIAVNCAAIPDNLIESELFGHEKGSFTGATGQRIGKFELCDGGT